MLKEKRSMRPWLALVGAFFLLFTSIGLNANGLTMFYKPVPADLGFTQTDFTLYYTLGILAGMVTYPVFGKIFSKYLHKLRVIMLTAGVVTLACYFGYAFSSKLWQFYSISIIRGFAGSALSTVPASMVVNNWFVEKRSTMMSIAFMGSSAGGVVYTKLSEALLSSYGWRTAYWVMGLVGFATVLIVVLVTAPSPESVGEKPYGYKPPVEGETPKAQWGLTSGQAMKTPLFWVLGIALLLGSVTVMGTQQVVATALQTDLHHSVDVAGNVVSVLMICICFGKLIVGWMFDRFNIRVGIIYSSLMVVAALAILASGTASVPLAFAFAVAFGLGNVNSTITSTTITSTVFGFKDYGTIYGFISMFMTGGMSVAPLIASGIYDSTGSYHNAWLLFLGLAAVTAVLLCLITVRAKKLRERF